MPASPTQPGFEMCIEVAHGDVLRSDGITGSHEKITFGDHVGTHVDALCHVTLDGAIFPGFPVAEAVADRRYVVGGIEQMPPYVGRAGGALRRPAAARSTYEPRRGRHP